MPNKPTLVVKQHIQAFSRGISILASLGNYIHMELKATEAVKAAFKFSKYTNTRLEMNFEDDTRLKIRAFNQSKGDDNVPESIRNTHVNSVNADLLKPDFDFNEANQLTLCQGQVLSDVLEIFDKVNDLALVMNNDGLVIANYAISPNIPINSRFSSIRSKSHININDFTTYVKRNNKAICFPAVFLKKFVKYCISWSISLFYNSISGNPLYVKANPEIPMQAEMYISAKCSSTDAANETEAPTSIGDQTMVALNADMTVMGERIPTTTTVNEELERRKRYHVSDTSSEEDFSDEDESRVSILRKIRRREQRFSKKVPIQHTQ
ncbi:DgyrCDS4082 [Dimorphilus gyrociliatus]|uniref:DgyrCDS4082 n=1 Tax=Dimorphilus gyrociliatus TaxID=2664684 RepID=A0A7I8VFC6_9ANNE|nr:DgyrCDS4082 [Dimorphilus gyrociliatus]